MKTKRAYFWISLGFTLLLGIILGVLFQRTIGIGNILRKVGIAYPTRSAILTETEVSWDEIPEAYQGEMALFILAGQSNMVGWAPLPQDQVKDEKIFLFGNDYRWRIAVEPVDDATGQIDLVSKDNSAGFGPSVAFASTVRVHRPEMVIGLIPCARSTTSIIKWQRNLSDQSLYGSCLKRVRAASTMGDIAGILFFQGENDTVDENKYPQFEPTSFSWTELFTAFVFDLPADLQQPNLPVVFAELGANTNPGEVPYWELVKEQQRSLELPDTLMITTDDLPTLDGLHFTTESYQVIGERFALAYLELSR